MGGFGQLLNNFCAKAASWLPLNQPLRAAPHGDTALRAEKGVAGVLTGAPLAAAVWKDLARCSWSQRGRERSAAVDESIGTSARAEAKQRSGNASEMGSSGAASARAAAGDGRAARGHHPALLHSWRGAEPSHDSSGMGSQLVGDGEQG